MKKIGNYWLPDKEEHMVEAYSQGGWHLDRLRECFNHIDKWNVAIDCGSHVGSWAIEMATKFKKVIAFEPFPETYECNKLNTETYSNIELYNKALSNKSHKIGFNWSKEHPDCTGGISIKDGIEGEAISLDSLDLKELDFFKMDVEGHEYDVIIGSLETIKKLKPIIMLEYKEKFISKGKNPLYMLESYGYKKVGGIKSDIVLKYD